MKKSIGAPARRAIFEAMVAMAWADARIEREEVLAVQAAGRLFAIPEDALDALDAGPPPVAGIGVSSLNDSERRLVYLCAAWLACVDAQEDSGEETLLDELRDVLHLPSTEATALRDEARVLRATASPSMRWHEELDALIALAGERVL
jgi:hypothetical protein